MSISTSGAAIGADAAATRAGGVVAGARQSPSRHWASAWACSGVTSSTGTAEYDGGELVITDSRLGAGLGCPRIKLPAGDAVLYPGSSVHRVDPVSRGQRLASFFWIESLVRNDEQRRLLFDMDGALIRLRSRDGESAEAVSLTGTYHNLLRRWADT